MITQSSKNSVIRVFIPEEIENWSRFLARGFHAGKLTFNEIKEYLLNLIMVDRQGTLWTIGAGSGSWYRHDSQVWIKDSPPEVLFLAGEVIGEMKATMLECPACHSRVPQGYRFCPQCGKPMHPETPDRAVPRPTAKPVFCRKCGKELQGAAKFCTHCGTPRRP